MNKRTYAVAELFAAASRPLMSVQSVYNLYDGKDPNYQEGITHVADILGDASRVSSLMAHDLKVQHLMSTAYEKGLLIGAIDRDEHNGTGIVAIRGTRTDQEWIDDFEFSAVHFDEVPERPLVHSGFHKLYLTFRQSMKEGLTALGPVNRIIVTGHSLGAAVATLCLLDLVSNGKSGIAYEGCTFASPRVFCTSTKLFDNKVVRNLRIANPVDIVTHLPLMVPFLYFHVVGGLNIDPKTEDFHDLQSTYHDKLVELAQREEAGGHDTVELTNAEDSWLLEKTFVNKLAIAGMD